jgi:hypothetical protein
VKLFVLVASLLCLCGHFRSAYAQTSPEKHTHESSAKVDWLEDFVDRLNPTREPASSLDSPDVTTVEGRSSVIAALTEHFRAQPPVEPLWVIALPDGRDPSHDTERADKAVNHLITTRAGQEQFGDLLPWYSPDKELATLSRFPHFDYLAPAYYHTNDEKYAQAMVRDMLDFVEHVPISGAGQYHVQVEPRINPWNWVLLQWRTKRWIDALAFLRRSPSLSDENYLRIVHHIWQETDWLVSHKNVGLHNGTLGNLSALLYAAINFPEAEASDRWLDDAGHFFNTFLDLGFYPGEFLIELTLGYSEGTLVHCLNIFEGFPDGPLKDQMSAKLERIVEAHVGMMKPDRSLPRYGDHGAYDISDRLLRRAGRLFGREDLAQMADNPSDPNPLGSRTSFPFESDPYYLSGYYAMRDGWDVEAQYLSMDAGPFGTNHHHGDKLSITVSADGGEFIVDPGTSLYRSIEPGPRIDLRPGFLHNVITIDGADPSAGWDRHYGFDVLPNRWVTTDDYDYLEGTYEFRSTLRDVVWRRSILYIKGEYWIILDALLGTGSHELESNFQFAIDSEVDIDGGQVVARAPNGATLFMATAAGDPLVPSIVVGDTASSNTTYLLQYWKWVDWVPGGRGWVGTFGNESKRDATRTYPAPAVVFSGTAELPHYSLRILSPSVDGRPMPVSLEWIERDREHLRAKVVRGGVTDEIEIEVAQRLDPRTALEDDLVRWSRTEQDRVIEIGLQSDD